LKFSCQSIVVRLNSKSGGRHGQGCSHDGCRGREAAHGRFDKVACTSGFETFTGHHKNAAAVAVFADLLGLRSLAK